MSWYVHRMDGSISSAHSEQKVGYADEMLADDDPELVAFLNIKPPKDYLRRRARALIEAQENFEMSMFKALDILVGEIEAIRASQPVTNRFTAMKNRLDIIKSNNPNG